jgi:hypothetical protein
MPQTRSFYQEFGSTKKAFRNMGNQELWSKISAAI